MKKRSLWLSAAGALVVAVALAGCGKTTYFAGRNLPPSGLINRVMIAIQNPSAFTKGALQIVDAFYDIRYAYNNLNKTFSISGYSGALPVTIQNMPEEQLGAVYSSGDGNLALDQLCQRELQRHRGSPRPLPAYSSPAMRICFRGQPGIAHACSGRIEVPARPLR